MSQFLCELNLSSSALSRDLVSFSGGGQALLEIAEAVEDLGFSLFSYRYEFFLQKCVRSRSKLFVHERVRSKYELFVQERIRSRSELFLQECI